MAVMRDRPQEPRSRRAAAALRAVIGLAALVAMAGGLAACGDERSPEAVCDVFKQQGVAFRDEMEQSNQSGDLLQIMAGVIGAPGRLADLMDKVEAVAPKDIEPAFNTLGEAFRKMADDQADNALNPLKALASGLSLSFNTKGSVDDVNQYLAEHCGRGTA